MNKEELKIKEDKIRKIIEENKLAGILLATRTNFLWFTGGKRNDVINNNDTSLVYLFITKNKKYLIGTKTDGVRVFEEELSDFGLEPLFYNWYNQSFLDCLKRIGVKGSIGSDFVFKDFQFIEEELSKVRVDLTDFEVKRVSKLSKEYSKLLTRFCLNLKPGQTEKEIANKFKYECGKKGINIIISMVGSDQRIFKYRHPIPTDKKVKNYVMLATGVEREGIIVDLTRSIYFGKVPEELMIKQREVNFIGANYIDNSCPGVKLKNLFKIGVQAYKKVGYTDEWKNHHQGGILDYKLGSYSASPNCERVLSNNNIVSWNPTITGVKSEDIILVKGDGAEQLSIDKEWPYEEITINNKSYIKPLILNIN